MWIAAGVVVCAVAGSAFGQVGPIAGKNSPGLPGSEANLATAKQKLTADRDKLDEMLKHRQELFEQSPEFKSAKKAVDDAVAALKDAKAKVVAELAKQPAYQTAKKRADAADAAAKGGTSDQAQAALAADGVVSKMENTAYAGDDGVTKADAGLKTAREALQKVKDDNEMKVKYDQHMVAQRDAIKKDQQQVDAWQARVTELTNAQNKKKKK
jgi:hypothetical protein